MPAKLRLAWRALWRCCEGSFTAAQFVTPCAWGDDHGTALARGAGCMVPRHPKASLRVAVSPQRVACPHLTISDSYFRSYLVFVFDTANVNQV